MDFALADHHLEIQRAVRDVVAGFGLDYWREKDKRKEYPHEIWAALAAGGWLGVGIPEEYGGAGLGFLESTLVVEEACRGGGGSTLAQLFMVTPIFGGETILRHGSAELRRELLPRIAAGEASFCMALTEPDAGSDALATRTTARADGDGYVLNGQKIWISAVPEADYVLAIARTSPPESAGKRSRGLSLFLVDRAAAGLSHAPLDKVGTNCVSSSAVFFDDVVVPKEMVIGEVDQGWYHLLDTLNTERIVTAAGCIATADLALRLACDYAGEREVFGRPIGTNQGIQFPLAERKIELEAARLLMYRAAWGYDRGDRSGVDANMAKFLAAEVGFGACEHAMQTMGGYGYGVEHHVERLWRDVRLFRLAPVSQELILSFVGRHVLALPRSY